MKSTYIIVLMLLTVLTFGGTSTALAQAATTPGYESTFETLKVVLRSIQNFFNNSLATVTGSYGMTSVVTVTTPVIANFGLVEYYPNLKSKIGFSSNAKDAVLSKAATGIDNKLDKIGPGILCSNIEFDLVYKHPEEAGHNAAITEQSIGGVTTTDPVPSPWLAGYEQTVGDLNVSQLYQITGAPAQYQLPNFINSGVNVSIHPAPTSVEGAAEFMGRWTADANHSYPVLWSFWNEPGHTFMGVLRYRNEFGVALESLSNETVAEYDARKILQLGSSSKAFAKMYSINNRAIRGATDPYSRIGFASFLAADFNPNKVTPENKVYFHSVIDMLAEKYPNTETNFVTLNNFNGGWPVSVSGARAVLQSRSSKAPLIVTQYSPSSLKVSESGEVDANAALTPMLVATEMLTDLAQIEKAADVQHFCQSYWVAGKYGFLTEGRNETLNETERYKVMSLFADLPIVRTKLDMTSLSEKKVYGLAGVNQAKAAVLFWNESADTVTFPVTFAQIPVPLQAVAKTVRIISDENTELVFSATAFDGTNLTLPPHGVALIEMKSGTVPDPLLRRQEIVSDSGLPAPFLQTKSLADRMTQDCTTVTKLPMIASSSCARSTGTYGFYDSVRSVAYLGRGEGSSSAIVTAVYRNVPAKLHLNTQLYVSEGSGISITSQPLRITAAFPKCNNKSFTAVASSTAGYSVLDFASGLNAVSVECRKTGEAVLTFTLAGTAISGTQAEVYVSSAVSEAISLSQNNRYITSRKIVPDIRENLVVVPFFQSMTGEEKNIVEPMNVIAVQACPQANPGCIPLPFTGDLTLFNDMNEAVVTFTPTAGGTVVRALRGVYTIKTALTAGNPVPAVSCPVILGELKASKGVTNDVTVACPVQ